MRNQPPYGGPVMMFPFMMPTQPPQAVEAETHTTPDTPVPTRVDVALKYLAMLHAKQIKRGAIADGATEPLILDGVKITTNEEGAEEAACELLAAYFRGNLPMDKWEDLRFDVTKRNMERHLSTPDHGYKGPCPQCGGRPGRRCKLCRGVGEVIIHALPGQSGQSEGQQEAEQPDMEMVLPEGFPNSPEALMRMILGGGAPQQSQPTQEEKGTGDKKEDPSDPKAGPEGNAEA